MAEYLINRRSNVTHILSEECANLSYRKRILKTRCNLTFDRNYTRIDLVDEMYFFRNEYEAKRNKFCRKCIAGRVCDR